MSDCLTVKLDFKPRERSQKRSKTLRTASRTIQTLEAKLKAKLRENNKLRKRNERLRAKQMKYDNTESTSSEMSKQPCTPKSKANAEIRDSNSLYVKSKSQLLAAKAKVSFNLKIPITRFFLTPLSIANCL